MTKRLITADDLTQFTFTGSPELSPDGKCAVYVVTKVNKEKNGYYSSLYLADGLSEPRRLTFDYMSDKLVKNHKPSFSKDGRSVYFLSDRSGKSQVWRLSLDGGDSQVLTDFSEDVTDYLLSPDESVLVCQSSIKDEREIENDDVTVVRRLRYLANGKGIISSTEALFLFNLQSHEKRLLTDKTRNVCNPAFSPDGKKFYFCQTKAEPDKTDYLYDIYIFDFETNKTTLFYKAKGNIYDLQVSPDGHWVAFAGNEDGECSPENIGIRLLQKMGDVAENLTEHERRSLGNYVGTDVRFDEGRPVFVWSEDGQSLTYLVQDGPAAGLKRIGLNGNISTLYFKEKEVITSFDSKNGAIVAVISSAFSTGDLYFINSDGTVKQASDHNRRFFDGLDLSEPVPFTYKAADDLDLDGWVMFPPDSAQTEKKIPVVLEIHGGPASAYGYSFEHEFQCLAAEGYAVVFTNPRGSRGYGAEFCAGCYDDWGRKDKDDILRGLDYVLDHFPTCDRSRQFVTGGSYGGFMTNTIVGTTHRFTAAVTQRSICNLYSFFGTSDISYYFLRRYFNGADLWTDEEKVMSFSPIRKAPNVTTPICIIHSEEDYRCPIEQAEQWYVALRRLGVETRFVRIKGENHELSRSGRPKNRLSRLHEIINWFNKHNTGNLSADQPDTKAEV
ncbi:S9 family peptidase [Sporolactobacillus putidus]|uniref:Peptidase S9 n=1 Tax=Sporolactobacillus putidus TaxID=492735 RepID=A0A917S424_9BACL|nr:S9 family peptidase [Sporolactobacillus putidus]GGL56734.1 peptidase S9 [Sporolactobacillus putidus]